MGSDLETSHDTIFELKMEEIEYIPFYGELKMTEEKKVEVKAKRIKTIKDKPHTEEAAIAAAEMLVEEVFKQRAEGLMKEVEELKPNVIAQILENIEPPVPDVPEPGVTDVSLNTMEADVTRRGYTTMHMARAAKNNTSNPENYLIVELRDVHSAILAYYVIHKAEEL